MNGTSAQLGGGLSYLVSQLPYLEGDVDLTVHVSAEAATALTGILKGSRIRVAPRITRFLAARVVWEQVVFPIVHARQADVIYSTGNTAAFLSRKPQVVVFQNAYHFGPKAIELLQTMHATRKRRVRTSTQRLIARASARRATLCVAVSESLATEMLAETRLRHKVHVVMNGAIGLAESPAGGVGELGLPAGKYALAIANDYLHKDWTGLIEAWRHCPELPLVLVGRVYSERRRAEILNAFKSSDNIHWFGEIADRGQLGAMYRSAAVYVAHSLLESFSLTPLEAMGAGTPVVASDIPAHREVCGDAALYYDPADGASLAHAVGEVVGIGTLGADLVARGEGRLRLFTWSKNASAVRDLLVEAQSAHCVLR